MAAIYLKHPDHGHKIAYHDAEASCDEGNGWERYDPEAPVVPKKRAKKDELPDFLKPKE